MPVSARARFDVFKRDNFTCRYCGNASPVVVLEVDHVIPVCTGGGDDLMNLVTSCWECNRGKSGVPLSQVVTGEDPHDRAVMLLERERQLQEYDAVLAVVNTRLEGDTARLSEYWRSGTGKTLRGAEASGLFNALKQYPSETIRRAMCAAIAYNKTDSLAYVHACIKKTSGGAADG